MSTPIFHARLRSEALRAVLRPCDWAPGPIHRLLRPDFASIGDQK
jgi:hypothetical protein